MHFEARRQSQNEERGDISVTVVDIANNEAVESYEKKERMLTKLPSEKESETQLYVSQEDQVFIYEISEPERRGSEFGDLRLLRVTDRGAGVVGATVVLLLRLPFR